MRQCGQDGGCEVEDGAEDGGAAGFVRGLDLFVGASLVGADGFEFDQEQPFGQVAAHRSGVDGGHPDDALEGQDADVVVGVEGAFDHAVPGHRLAQGVGEPGRDAGDVVQHHGPGRRGLHGPGARVLGCRAQRGRGGVDQADQGAAGGGLAGALLSGQGQDRVRDVREDGGDQPGDQQPESGLADVEQVAQPVQPAGGAGGHGQR